MKVLQMTINVIFQYHLEYSLWTYWNDIREIATCIAKKTS